MQDRMIQWDDEDIGSNSTLNPNISVAADPNEAPKSWQQLTQRVNKYEYRIQRAEKAIIGLKRQTQIMIKHYGLTLLAILSVIWAAYCIVNFWYQRQLEKQRQQHNLELLLLDKISSKEADQWQRQRNLVLLAETTQTPPLKQWATTEEQNAKQHQLSPEESAVTITQNKLGWPLGNTKPEPSQVIYEPYRRGISIKANLGDPIVAVEDGKIIYASNDLPGYGNLVIIQHESELMSIYAHNYANYVDNGDFVYRGQLIAVAGQLPSTESGLYFEIRQAGKAHHPFNYFQAF